MIHVKWFFAQRRTPNRLVIMDKSTIDRLFDEHMAYMEEAKKRFMSAITRVTSNAGLVSRIGNLRVSGRFGKNKPLFSVADLEASEDNNVLLVADNVTAVKALAAAIESKVVGAKAVVKNNRALQVSVDFNQLMSDEDREQFRDVGVAEIRAVFNARTRCRESLQRASRTSQTTSTLKAYIEDRLNDIEYHFHKFVDEMIQINPSLESSRPKTRIAVDAARVEKKVKAPPVKEPVSSSSSGGEDVLIIRS